MPQMRFKAIDNNSNMPYIKDVYTSEICSNSIWVNGLSETLTPIPTVNEPLDFGSIEINDHDDHSRLIPDFSYSSSY